jgi:hypothetical protein
MKKDVAIKAIKTADLNISYGILLFKKFIGALVLNPSFMIVIHSSIFKEDAI